MNRFTVSLLAMIFIIPTIAPAQADPLGPPTISVTGHGSVQFTPDIVRISLGVRTESPSAGTAAAGTNSHASAVVGAIRKLGIPDSDIKTSGYDIEYQPPPESAAAVQYAPPPAAAGQVQTQSIVRKPIPPSGSYVATETISVKAPIDKAGSILDAGVSAGANETYGISFDTSMRDSLYREALGRAVADAHAQAEVLARGAGVSIAGLQTLGVEGGSAAPMPMMGARMTLEAAPPPVMGGTDTVDATVDAVYRIR